MAATVARADTGVTRSVPNGGAITRVPMVPASFVVLRTTGDATGFGSATPVGAAGNDV